MHTARGTRSHRKNTRSKALLPFLDDSYAEHLDGLAGKTHGFASADRRPVDSGLVAEMSARVTKSGVLDRLDNWRREDNVRPSKARMTVSDRAVLVGLLILSGEDAPLHAARLAELLEYRIDPDTHTLLEIPAALTAGHSPIRTTARWTSATTRALHRLLAVIDPFPQTLQQPLSYAEISDVLADRDVDLEKFMKLRLDAFTQSFLQMTFDEQPEPYRDPAGRINIAIGDHMIPLRSKTGFPTQKPADRVAAGVLATRGGERDLDVFATWHRNLGTLRVRPAGSRRPSDPAWGREASIAVRIDTDPATAQHSPRLVVSATLRHPNRDLSHTALTLMNGALETGLRPGIVDTDRAYFGTHPANPLPRLTAELGFTPSTDYRYVQLQVRNHYDGARWIEGHAYCSEMPATLVDATADFRDNVIDRDTFDARIRLRRTFQLRTSGKPTKAGTLRMTCPVHKPTDAPTAPSPQDESAQAPQSDDICTGRSVVIAENDLVRRQAFTYGTKKWREFHVRARLAAEAVNSRIKHSSTAHIQGVDGFAATQVLLTMTLTTYNLREIARAASLRNI